LNDFQAASRALLSQVVAVHGSGEIRPQQQEMVDIVSHAIEHGENAVVQAGTGVGKSLGYMIPAALSGKRVVISTATKQLSEQLAEQDVPFLAGVMDKNSGTPLSYAILKGRANYACFKKIQELKDLESQAPPFGADAPTKSTQDALFPSVIEETAIPEYSTPEQRGQEVGNIIQWVDTDLSTDGDRSHGPQVSDATWKTVSATPSECPGKTSCPFGNACFAEIARNRARVSNLVVTNHALVATELSSASGEQWAAIGHRDTVIFDEVHELDNYLSNIWGCSVSGRTLEEAARDARRAVPANELKTREAIEEMSQLGEKLAEYLENAEDTLVETAWAPEVAHVLEAAYLKSRIISAFLASKKDSEDTRVLLAGNVLDELGENIYMLQSGNTDTVRWIGQGDSGARALRAAPLRVGPRLMEALEESETNMIATSATISVGRSFDIPVRNLALDESERKYIAKDVGTPFDYPKQAILYIPTPGDFPAPTGKERFEHTEAMLEELVRIVKAAGGRTLALSTTTSGARRMAERLRDEVDTPVLSQWDATPGVISQRFAEEETSTLCATMGMWHGLNVPGRSLSAVVIDKIPFPPMNDPLLKARQKDVDDRGGNGFMDVYVAQASAMLAQGVGRLIRNTQDRGMVAILDTRIMSARYGRTILGSLPGMWLTHDGAMATTSLKRLIDADQSA